MLVGTNLDNVQVGNVLDCSADVRNHTENADGACEGGGVGENLVAIVGDPVSAGGCVISIRGNHRLYLCGEVNLSLDLFRCEHASSRGVHPEHHRLYGGVRADFGNDLGETRACNFAVLGSVNYLAVGVDDGNLLLCLEVVLNL